MIIYTDGSAHPNPGPGGFGCVIYDDNENFITCYQHSESHTTNNIQEIKSILYAMITYGKYNPIVYSDSAYCVNIFTNWMFGWERKDWLKSDNKPPENLELIKGYFKLYQQGYRIDLRKVKGHVSIKGNELADKLATEKMSVEEVKKLYGKCI